MTKAINKNGKFNSAAGIAIFCLAAAGGMTVQAQDSSSGTTNQTYSNGSTNQSYSGGNYSSGSTNQAETAPAPGQPLRMNKCSHLIGTEVENSQGDKLGKIEEVVVDFENGRVSYCVLRVEHKLFSTPKYVAVPLAAFRPNQDGMRLILNADKAKVEQAQGFDRDHWPSANNPAWGAQPFWQTTPGNMSNPSNIDKNSPSGTNP
jgi:sporulation protein YlmC with PRC-barrel domain